MSRPSFPDQHMEMARVARRRATCRKKVGAHLVNPETERTIATGYNGAPADAPHCDDEGCIDYQGDCVRSIHAEMNVIGDAARAGRSTMGAALYVTEAPCHKCAPIVIAAGIVAVYAEGPYTNEEKGAVVRGIFERARVHFEVWGR